MCFLEKVNPKQVRDNAFAANQTVNALKKKTSEGREGGKKKYIWPKKVETEAKRERGHEWMLVSHPLLRRKRQHPLVELM